MENDYMQQGTFQARGQLYGQCELKPISPRTHNYRVALMWMFDAFDEEGLYERADVQFIPDDGKPEIKISLRHHEDADIAKLQNYLKLRR
jgi:hypothetical protein